MQFLAPSANTDPLTNSHQKTMGALKTTIGMQKQKNQGLILHFFQKMRRCAGRFFDDHRRSCPRSVLLETGTHMNEKATAFRKIRFLPWQSVEAPLQDIAPRLSAGTVAIAKDPS